MSLGLANVRVGSVVMGMNNEFSFLVVSSLLLQLVNILAICGLRNFSLKVPMHPHLDHSLPLQARESFRVQFIGKKPAFALADKGTDETFQHCLSSE